MSFNLTADNMKKVSVIINNYNYSRYVRHAVESALQQSYPDTEVIIVDDGSTDSSGDILQEYQDRTTIIYKKNGGQASAFNEGFKASTGDIILFLDADDCLDRDSVQKVVDAFDDKRLSKVHWSLNVIDENGLLVGVKTPNLKLAEGDLVPHVIELGPNGYISPPTSGNAWSRKFLDSVMPMPENPYSISADSYLCMLAPLYGTIKAIQTPHGQYRLHGENNYRGNALSEALLESRFDRYERSCEILMHHFRKLGMQPDLENWHRQSWLKKLKQSFTSIKKVVPENESFILADGDQWQVRDEIAGRQIKPFTEKNNMYWGPPGNDAAAIEEIQRQMQDKTGYIFFAWPVFWWLDHYKGMLDYLKHNHQCMINDEHLVGFKLIHPV